MSGIASLIGGNSAKTDRQQELDARDQSRSIFNYAMPQAQQSQAQGNSDLGQAGAYFGSLLRSGRTGVAQQAAPAINAQLSAADAAKRREAITGTGRTGGTAEADRMSDATTQGGIDTTINQTDQENKAAAAQGEATVGSDEQRQALGLLGLSGTQIDALLNNTMQSRAQSQQIHNSDYDRVGQDVGTILGLPLGDGGGTPGVNGGAGTDNGASTIGSSLAHFFF